MLTRLEWGYSAARPYLLLVLALCGVLHTGRLLAGHDTCKLLVGPASSIGGGGQWHGREWQPHACILAPYGRPGARLQGLSQRCLAEQTILFLGDSRIRQLYAAFAAALDPKNAPPADNALAPIHSDLEHRVGQTRLVFIWAPELNDPKALAIYDKVATETPDVIFHSAGLWALKRGELPADMAQTAVVGLRTHLENAATHGAAVFWLPVAPVVEELLWEPRRAITNKHIDEFNKLMAIRLGDLVAAGIVEMPLGIIELHHKAIGAMNATGDGLHFNPVVVEEQASVLLNRLCNPVLSNDVPPMTSCCMPFEPPRLGQIFMLALFVICILVQFCLLYVWPEPADATALPHTIPTKSATSILRELVSPLSVISAIMLYIFLCDRTPLFLKTSKAYSPWSFYIPLAACVVLFLGTLRESKTATVLNRDMTDEWKGWMQIVFLVYHYTAASQVLFIYFFVRVFVASYLFMTGYGHFVYFYKKNNYSWTRILTVVTRVNLFALFLCLTMDRAYLFYYFVPLSTFWFLVVCAVMRIGAERNTEPTFLVLKLGGFLAVCGVFWMALSGNDEFSSAAARFFSLPGLAHLLDFNGSLHEWLFRSALDRYSVGLGMAVAFAFLWMQSNGMMNDASDSTLFPRFMSIGIVFLCAVTVVGYGVFGESCVDKIRCNQIHPYSSLLCIMAYVLLRNMWPWCRAVHSELMARAGRISLELFLGQYHMWLAMDTKGLLVLIPGMPVLNAALTSLLFLMAASALSDAFQKLTTVIMGDSLSSALRNIAICLSVCGVVFALNMLNTMLEHSEEAL
eukprot:m.19109 g.19109  ORF g.19109 m.19109 type:complete len:798 (-) comp3720_c0_seq1:88-2481(-)